MRIEIPRPAPRETGDYGVWVTPGYGDPRGTIHLAENGILDLRDLSADDCDRLIRAACKAREEILRYQAEMAAPHGRKRVYQGTCQLCGKPEDDELHAEPVVVTEARFSITPEAAALAAEAAPRSAMGTGNVHDDDEESLQFADESEWMDAEDDDDTSAGEQAAAEVDEARSRERRSDSAVSGEDPMDRHSYIALNRPTLAGDARNGGAQ